MFFNTLIINFPNYTIIYITRKYVMNQTNTHNNNIIYAYSKMSREVISCWEMHGACPQSCADMPRTMGHVRTRTYFYILPNIFFSGGNYTLITCIQYTTMVTHSECEISQSWRTQFSSHGALNLNRAVMPPYNQNAIFMYCLLTLPNSLTFKKKSKKFPF